MSYRKLYIQQPLQCVRNVSSLVERVSPCPRSSPAASHATSGRFQLLLHSQPAMKVNRRLVKLQFHGPAKSGMIFIVQGHKKSYGSACNTTPIAVSISAVAPVATSGRFRITVRGTVRRGLLYSNLYSP
jgi:hypothetical protein